MFGAKDYLLLFLYAPTVSLSTKLPNFPPTIPSLPFDSNNCFWPLTTASFYCIMISPDLRGGMGSESALTNLGRGSSATMALDSSSSSSYTELAPESSVHSIDL